MKPALKEYLQTLTGVAGAHIYTMPTKTVPVVVVKDTHLPVRTGADEMQGRIILTVDDIQYGKDVFGVTFLHIQQRSVHVKGEDFFTDMIIPHETLRMDLESILRHVLIDIREHLVMHRAPGSALTTMLQNVLDRIWLTTTVLLGETPYGLAYIKPAVYHIDSVLGTKQKELYEMVFENKTLVMQTLYKELIGLVHLIDGFGRTSVQTETSVSL